MSLRADAIASALCNNSAGVHAGVCHCLRTLCNNSAGVHASGGLAPTDVHHCSIASPTFAPLVEYLPNRSSSLKNTCAVQVDVKPPWPCSIYFGIACSICVKLSRHFWSKLTLSASHCPADLSSSSNYYRLMSLRPLSSTGTFSRRPASRRYLTSNICI